MNEQNEFKIEQRELRRQRRRRNQIYSYLFLVIFLILIVIGIVITYTFIKNRNTTFLEEENQITIEEMIGEEESLEVPEYQEEIIYEMTDLEKLDEIINAVIDVMPIEDKVANLFVVTPEAITGVSTAIKAGEGTKNALSQYAVGGIIYFSKNIQNEEQISEMIKNTMLYSKYPLFIGIDEEGGSVSRLSTANIYESIVGAKEIVARGDTALAYETGSIIGTTLNELGFNVDFAPVADLANIKDSIMDGRSFGEDAQTAVPYIVEIVRALEDNGVNSCLKHFPGIGSTAIDTHTGLAITERTIEEFRSEEFLVFKAGIEAGAQMIMVGHILAPALAGDNTPSTLSKEVITDYLRRELEFNGVIITDAMNMSSISEYYSSDEAAVLALKAGCDMILMPEDFELAYHGVLMAIEE